MEPQLETLEILRGNASSPLPLVLALPCSITWVSRWVIIQYHLIDILPMAWLTLGHGPKPYDKYYLFADEIGSVGMHKNKPVAPINHHCPLDAVLCSGLCGKGGPTSRDSLREGYN